MKTVRRFINVAEVNLFKFKSIYTNKFEYTSVAVLVNTS